MLIRHGRVLDPVSGAFSPADLLIADGLITGVGEGLLAPGGTEVLDATGMLIVPGLVNAHTHAHGSLFRAVADNWTLEDLLNHGAAMQRGRTAREQYVSAAIGAIEMLKSGCTGVFDLFMALPAPTEEGCEAVARAYGDSGMRGTLAPAVADQVFYQTVPGLIDALPPNLRAAVEQIEAAPADGLIAMMDAHIRRWHGSFGGRIRAAVAPTIPGQCSDRFLQDCVGLARAHGVGIHTHLAETKVQIVHAARRWGMSPLSALMEAGAVDEHFVGAHGIWLSDDDISVLARCGSTVAHNPMSNLRLGSGIAPVRELLDAGVNVALGSDGSTCSDNQNIYEAMHFAGTIGNVRQPHDPEYWITSAETWHMATSGGTKALGFGSEAAIVPGANADLVLLDGGSEYLRPMNNALNTLVYAETGASVRTVLVAGEIVVRDGVVLTLDEKALRDEAQEAAERIMASNSEQWTFAIELEPYLRAACRSAVATPLPIERYAANSAFAAMPALGGGA